MRIPCEVDGLCYDFDYITQYFNRPEVQEELGAVGPWSDCSSAVGNKAWARKLAWRGAEAFNLADDTDWKLGSDTVAKLRSAQGFHFMQIYEAGHMVPTDQPAVALAMVNAFTSGTLSIDVSV